MTCAGGGSRNGRGVYLTGGHRRHARERRASSVVAGKRVVRRTWGEARVALAYGWGRLRHASLAANTGFKSWHAWDTWPSGPLPNARARMIFAAIR